MKLSSIAVLFGGAVAVFCPGVSAATVSMKELYTEEESLFKMNCANQGNCDKYGYNTCTRINNQCDGLCVWSGSRQNGSCKKGVKKSCKTYKTGSDCFAAGCAWQNNVCRNPQSNAKCMGYTSRTRCVNNGCFWNRNTRTCSNTNNTNRGCIRFSTSTECRKEGCIWRNNSCREPSQNGGGGTKCTGPNDRTGACKLNEFCYTRGECSTNARGECVLKPKTFAGCRKGKKRFNTFSTSGGNACISNQFFNSECQAAIAGQNIPLRPNDEVEALDSEEFDHEEFVSAEDE
mmetsp:Transcript_800/g.1208  ORF Transcript_800/g.1208 Transcript_800/m.1208 type:complete len:289 (-) Transcript_800:308-1174(-)